MNSATEEKDDQAWVSIDVPLPIDEVITFCQDIERLLRINPMLEFSDFKTTDNDQFLLKGKNLSNAQVFDLELQCEPLLNGLKLNYKQGLKCYTAITITAASAGCQIKILDDYSTVSEDDRNQRLDEVDKSLHVWGEAIQSYLKSWKRWSASFIWRWYMQRVWLPMKPSARRITSMLIGITALEFIAFLMVFAIFWLELDNFFRL